MKRVVALAMLIALLGCLGCTSVNAPPSTDADAPVELGPTAADELIGFTVSLHLPGAARLDAYLAGLHVPGSPSYRHYLRPHEFGQRFGISDARLDKVVAWLRGAGLSVTVSPQRTSVEVSGAAEVVNQALGVTLVDRVNSAGERYHAPLGAPAVPAELGTDVAGILGLDTEPVIRPAITPAGIMAAGVGPEGLLPATVARAYEIEPLHALGLRGEGQAVAIVSFDTFTPSDVDLFDERFAIDSAPVEIVRLAGASDEPGPGTGEVALDIQVIRGIAPQARIINYEAPNSAQGFAGVIARIVADDQVRVVSISWGLCEIHAGRNAIEAMQREFAAAFAAGISVFSASGDDGAFDCRRVQISEDPFERDLSQSTDWPSSSPSVVGVGGTFLSIREDGTYIEEAGWEEPLSGGGGGGGLSRFQDRPDWQQGPGVDNSASNGRRQVPDVAGPADPTSGFAVTYTQPDQGLVAGRVGGTSAAAPFWAASMLLTTQLAQQEGVEALGPLGPVLYQVSAEQPVGSVFHDIVRGGNLLFSAGPGWDYSTGLGTPRVAPLARAIVDFVSR